MSYGLSIDVGTSFTAAAVLRTGGPVPDAPQILPLGSRAATIPTVVFIGEDGTRLVGEAAERRGLAQPECVTREFKRRMGDDVPLMVGGTEVLPQDLLAAVVSWVVGVAVEREGGSPDTVTLTHPVGWGEHRTSLLRSALADAGIDDVVLLTEPEAAALSYASREHVASGSTLAVYDLGGGTFDATVVRKTDADSFTVLGVPQGLERLGGADFDQEVFHSVLDSANISSAELDPSAPEVLAALNRLRRECAEAKEALSSDSEATVSVMIPGAHSQVRLVRSEFEAMIEPALAETVDTLRSALESAGVRAEELTAILLIGGSSRIPLVAQLLSEEFNRPLAIDVDPKASVALGAVFATAALEHVPGQDEAGDSGAARGSGVPAARTNAAGFALPSGRPASVPLHGPVAMAPNKRLGIRVGAIAAAVALLGIATASATNAPNPLAAISALAGDPRAEAAEEPAPAPATQGATPAPGPTAGAGPVGPLAAEPEAGQTFLDRAGVREAAPADDDDSAEDAPAGSEDASPSTGKASESPRRGAATPEESPGAAPGSAPSSSSQAPASGAKPGTVPVDPTPPVPFPSSNATPTPNPVTQAPDPTTPPTTDPPTQPPVEQPTTPPAPEPTTDPTVPPPPAPEPQPTTEPAAEPSPPAADPTPTDPPRGGEPTASSAPAEA